jgi:hypothetical protein
MHSHSFSHSSTHSFLSSHTIALPPTHALCESLTCFLWPPFIPSTTFSAPTTHSLLSHLALPVRLSLFLLSHTPYHVFPVSSLYSEFGALLPQGRSQYTHQHVEIFHLDAVIYHTLCSCSPALYATRRPHFQKWSSYIFCNFVCSFFNGALQTDHLAWRYVPKQRSY